MPGAYPHLLLNHIPLFGSLAAFLLLAAGAKRKSADLVKAGLLILVLSGLGTVATYFTGEPAESVVKDLPGVSRDAIEEHEEAALFALIGLLVGGAWAAVVWFRYRHDPVFPPKPIVVLALFSALVLAITVRVALLGGEVRHSELRPAGPAAGAEPTR